MIDFHHLKNTKVLVMGLGLHGGGVSVARWFLRKGATVTVTDLKNKKDLGPSLKKLKGLPIKYVLGGHRNSDFKENEIIIQNPGVPRESKFLKIAKKAGVLVENEASVFFRLCPAPIIAVTGTKGKSSLVSLLYHVIRKRYPDTVMAGNIRDVLMLDVLDNIKKSTKVILELSSWHLEGLEHIKKSPHVALLTNIMPDHLNRYHSLANYIKAKQLILKFQKNNDIAIINADNFYTKRLGYETRAKVYWFSLEEKISRGAFLSDRQIVFVDHGKKEKLFSMNDMSVIADYQKEQILAATIAAKIFGLKKETIYSGIKSYKGLHDRLEFLGVIKGIRYYNDTAATMPEAAVTALKSLGNIENKNIILLAGGADKNLKFDEFSQNILKYCRATILFKGRASDKILKLIRGKIDYIIVNDMKHAVLKAKKFAKTGDIILLSPGAASFGLFKHEFDRGEQFKKNIK